MYEGIGTTWSGSRQPHLHLLPLATATATVTVTRIYGNLLMISLNRLSHTWARGKITNTNNPIKTPTPTQINPIKTPPTQIKAQ
jgi:hypothetical protein